MMRVEICKPRALMASIGIMGRKGVSEERSHLQWQTHCTMGENVVVGRKRLVATGQSSLWCAQPAHACALHEACWREDRAAACRTGRPRALQMCWGMKGARKGKGMQRGGDGDNNREPLGHGLEGLIPAFKVSTHCWSGYVHQAPMG